jgi:hypothetical protein
VRTERSREMPSNDNVSTATTPPCNVAETQAGSDTGSETEESDGRASEKTLCGHRSVEVTKTFLRSDREM